MHENLKYTLKLDENIKEFEQFEDKKPQDKNDRAEISDWQAIFAGNNYGTHYLIYARFLGKKVGTKFKVSKIQLYIQNYSGQVSVGFVDHDDIEEIPIGIKDPDTDPRFPNRKKFKLSLAVQGLNSKKITHSFKPKNIELSTSDIIMTDTFVVPIDSDISKIYSKKKRASSSFVDEMFMGRMGSNVFVTETGKDELFRIHLLNKKLVTEKNLKDAGVDEKSYKNFTAKPITSKFSIVDTPRYPCIPIYSICDLS
jgi:hypothetical protein